MLPVVTYNPTRDLWILDRPWALVRPEFTLRIPSGFTFDLSSVPRPLWPLCAIHELGIRAPLVHDALYQYAGEIPAEWVAPTRTFRRSEADRLFRELMAEAEISWLRRWAAWAAVRAFGFLAWRRRR